MNSLPRAALCFALAAAGLLCLLSTAAAEASFGKTYAGDVSVIHHAAWLAVCNPSSAACALLDSYTTDSLAVTLLNRSWDSSTKGSRSQL